VSALTNANDVLQALLAEQSGVDDEILRARRAGDIPAVVRLELRKQDLPVEIREAEREFLPLQVAAAWRVAEAAEAQVPAFVTAYAEARAAVQAFVRDTPRPRDAVESAQYSMGQATVGSECEQARVRLADARDAVIAALLHVDVLEERVQQLTGEPPVDGEGLRARPGFLTKTLVFSMAGVGSRTYEAGLAVGVDVTGFSFAGSRPPRWRAYGVDPALFAETPAPAPAPIEETRPAPHYPIRDERKYEKQMRAHQRRARHEAELA
jgi:hypothetical protein